MCIVQQQNLIHMYCGAMFNIDIWDSAQGRLTVVHYYTACGGALADPVRGSPMFGHTWWLPMLIKLAFMYVVRFSYGRESAKSSFICLRFLTELCFKNKLHIGPHWGFWSPPQVDQN